MEAKQSAASVPTGATSVCFPRPYAEHHVFNICFKFCLKDV